MASAEDNDVYDLESVENEGSDYDIDDTDNTDSLPPENDYVILKESDIRARVEDDIARVTNVLSVSRDAACKVLRHCNWSVTKAHEDWFSDEDNKLREAVGLLTEPAVDGSLHHKSSKITCGVCFESFSHKNMESAACGHLFCEECWAGYIAASIDNGPACLFLRCPEPSCVAFVGQELINRNSLVSDENKEKYDRYLYRSYVEENKNTKWCPSPGCEYAVLFVRDAENYYDVTCCCTHRFCWNCTEEAHRPVDCKTVAKWTLKNSSESENTNWLIANSKPCPKCKRPIEKNAGCMHMTCRPPCGFNFCWLCLRGLSEHRGCNGYQYAQGEQGALNEDEMRRERAKKMVERYAHYFERWASNHKSMQTALSDFRKVKTVTLAKIGKAQSTPETLLSFIIEAWKQIVECRRVLKWSYAYGFYLPEEETTKRQFFEYLQGQAESGLERLHQCAETELGKFVIAVEPPEAFAESSTKLVGLTRVTKDYFENLVRALENGLTDVKMEESLNSLAQKTTGRSIVIEAADWANWSCPFCTFINERPLTVCRMCNQPE